MSVVKFEEIRFDCALYNGYKPCVHGNYCPGCVQFVAAEGAEADAGAPVCGPTPTEPRAEHAPFTILMIKTGALGDVLRTTALLQPLQRAHPDMHLVWLTDPSAVPLLQHNPFIREVQPFNETTVEWLAGRDFDLLINLEKEKAPLQLAGRIRARERRGFAPTRLGTPTVFNAAARHALVLGISDELKFRINTRSYPSIVAEASELDFQRDPYVLIPSEESARVADEIRARLPHPGRPVIGLNSGCGAVFRTKQWTLENWVELVHSLQAQGDANILLLGGKAEQELNAAIIARTHNVVDTGTENSLPAFFGIVDACDLVVTSDSLGMHIAIALQKQVVALFGSTSATEIDLYDRGEKVITDFPCHPCYLKTCPLPTTCMEAMRGSAVAEAVLRRLAATE